MAIQIDQIRALADRIAASHALALVDVEFSGGAKHRTLRVFIEKDAPTRSKLAADAVAKAAAGQPTDLPANVPVEMLSGVTHEDCEQFARDFGTTLDVEYLIPGAEYTLEVSSPGLERKLSNADDFKRFRGSLVRLQTFTAVDNNRHWQGRLSGFADNSITLDLSAVKQKGKARKAAAAVPALSITIALSNVEKASLLAEF